MPQLITPTEHDRSEWFRLSVDCRKHKRVDASVFYAKLSAGTVPIAIDLYDRAQRYYRGWLLTGFPKD